MFTVCPFSLSTVSTIGLNPSSPFGISKWNTASFVSSSTVTPALASALLSTVVTVPMLGMYVVPSIPSFLYKG